MKHWMYIRCDEIWYGAQQFGIKKCAHIACAISRRLILFIQSYDES